MSAQAAGSGAQAAGVPGRGAGEPDWLVACDRGGTFTDWVVVAPDGRSWQGKMASRLADGREAALPWEVIGEVLVEGGCGRLEGGPAWERVSARLGTTVATNLLLEGAGTPPLLVVTEGMEDVLVLGDGTRPELFDAHAPPPVPLTEWVVGAPERRLAGGLVDRRLDAALLAERLQTTMGTGGGPVGGPAVVSLLHAPSDGSTEHEVGELLRARGHDPVVLGSEALASPSFRDRTEAAVLEGWLAPGTGAALDGLLDGAPAVARVDVQRSDGGLEPASGVAASALVLSGPAGGALAVATVGRRCGMTQAVGLDMGGTTTDVSRWSADAAPVLGRRRLAGRALAVPMLPVHSVASGGGSRLGWAAGRPMIGPESAGARPGPASYGYGGPATVCDALVVLGRSPAVALPAVFGASGAAPLDEQAAADAIAALAAAHGLGGGTVAVARGYLELAVQRMAAAIGGVTVQDGHDVRDHVLVGFGGAGPQVAVRLAEVLGMRAVVVPREAGVLSARGIADAPARRRAESVVEAPLAAMDEAAWAAAEARTTPLAGEPGWRHQAWAVLRQRGRRGEETVPLRPLENLAARWTEEHERRHGYRPSEVDLMVARIVVEASLTRPPSGRARGPSSVGGAAALASVLLDGTQEAPVWRDDDLGDGARVEGPALVAAAGHVMVVEAEWTAEARGMDWWLQRGHAGADPGAVREVPDSWIDDPLALEVVDARLSGICAQMGETLCRTARSVNIAERRDLSCGVFDAAGELVTNAAHIPVHLGAMGRSVAALLDARRDAQGEVDWPAGQHLATNDPRAGGSHLPDITVVSPVHDAGGGLVAFVASRAHHADVGGLHPGSMSPEAVQASEEGVRLHAVVVAEGDRLQVERLRALVEAGPAPVRDVSTLLADLEAQVSAGILGVSSVGGVAAELGDAPFAAALTALLDRGEEVVRARLASLAPCSVRACDWLDDSTPLALALDLTPAGSARLDLAGTGTHRGHLHAPRAVVEAAVLHALRCLVQEPLRLNGGCLRAIELVIPPGSLLDPPEDAAVAGGNVETSQRLVDLVLRGLGAMADSCGTMSNLTLGDASFGVYETLPGGAGARPDGGPLGSLGAAGLDGRQVHMTNTRGSDVEVLERAHPIVVRRLGLRRGSGGAGAHRGGDGTMRELEALVPLEATFTGERRRLPPLGLDGGECGQPGRSSWIDRHGRTHDLSGHWVQRVAVGERLHIETPGGGGAGSPR